MGGKQLDEHHPKETTIYEMIKCALSIYTITFHRWFNLFLILINKSHSTDMLT